MNRASPMEMLIYTGGRVSVRVVAGIVMIFGALGGIDVLSLDGILWYSPSPRRAFLFSALPIVVIVFRRIGLFPKFPILSCYLNRYSKRYS